MRKIVSMLLLLAMLVSCVSMGWADTVAETAAAEELIIRTHGCAILFVDDDGNAKGEEMTELNFGEEYVNTATGKTVTDGSVQVRINANVAEGETVEYWVINGAKYTFNREVKSFILREVPYAMTIEAVTSSAEGAQTMNAEEAAEENAEALVVKSKDAYMNHVDENNEIGGEGFREFDFTEDYVNTATNETELGGQVSVRVKAVIEEGNGIAFWRFNGARFSFNADVTSFVVEGLEESMLYQPFFYVARQKYTITCRNCYFSGGGYTNATSGTVLEGTKIVVTPNGTSYLGWWTGSRTTGEVSAKDFGHKVNGDCYFYWHDVIN